MGDFNGAWSVLRGTGTGKHGLVSGFACCFIARLARGVPCAVAGVHVLVVGVFAVQPRRGGPSEGGRRELTGILALAVDVA